MKTHKKCKNCGREFEIRNFNQQDCSPECYYKRKGPNTPKENKTPLKRSNKGVSKKVNTGEKKLFKQIAIEREVEGCCICVDCGKNIPLGYLSPANFDHEIPKSRGAKYRLDKENIKIKCFACHFRKTTGLNLKTEYNN